MVLLYLPTPNEEKITFIGSVTHFLLEGFVTRTIITHAHQRWTWK